MIVRQMQPITAVVIHTVFDSGRKSPTVTTTATHAMVDTRFSTTTDPSSIVLPTFSPRAVRRRRARSTLTISPRRAASTVLNRNPTKSGLTRSRTRVRDRIAGKPSTTPFHAHPLNTTEAVFAAIAAITKAHEVGCRAARSAPRSTFHTTRPAAATISRIRIGPLAFRAIRRTSATSVVMRPAR